MKTKTLVTTALCIALGVVLPIAFHAFGAGSTFLPMHLPVLLCGLACGPVYGLLCGIITPILSSLMTGMPPAAMLPSMICELAVYGLVAGICVKVFRIKNTWVRLYLSLIVAMLCGRVVAGILNGLIFKAGAYSIELWITGMFVTGLPGILIQLIVVPALVIALQKAKLISLPTVEEKA